MTEDLRCCGTGTCIINEDGLCWCGQKWDGEKMCFPRPKEPISQSAKAPLSQSLVEGGMQDADCGEAETGVRKQRD